MIAGALPRSEVVAPLGRAGSVSVGSAGLRIVVILRVGRVVLLGHAHDLADLQGAALEGRIASDVVDGNRVGTLGGIGREGTLVDVAEERACDDERTVGGGVQRRYAGPEPRSVMRMAARCRDPLMLNVPALSRMTLEVASLVALVAAVLMAFWMAVVSSPPLGESVAAMVVRFGMPPLYVTPGCHGVARSDGSV